METWSVTTRTSGVGEGVALKVKLLTQLKEKLAPAIRPLDQTYLSTIAAVDDNVLDILSLIFPVSLIISSWFCDGIIYRVIFAQDPNNNYLFCLLWEF